MKKVIAEGHEFIVREANIRTDFHDFNTFRSPYVKSIEGYDIELRLEMRMSKEDYSEFMDLIRDGRVVLVAKR